MAGELAAICRMLGDPDPERQCAAAMVLSELKPRDKTVRKALVKALKADNDSVRLYAAEALCRIDPKEGPVHLVPLLAAPGHVRSRVMELLDELGAASVKALKDQLGTKDSDLRSRTLEALGQLRGADTTDALFAGLLDADLEVVREAARAFQKRAGDLTEAERAKASKRILEFMASPRVIKQRTPLASCLQILRTLKDPSSVKPVLAYTDKKHPPAARTEALRALAGLPVADGPAAKSVVTKLLPLLDDKDLDGIVLPALEALRRIPMGKEQAARAPKLLRSKHAAVKLYGLRALGGSASAASAQPLLEALFGPDPRAADMAAATLRGNKAFVPALLKALGKEKDAKRQWKVVGLLRAHASSLDKPTLRKFAAQLVKMVEKRVSGFQVYFEILRSAGPDILRDTILKKGEALLAKKKFADAEVFLKLLQTGDLATPEVHYALARAQLKRQRKDLGMAGRDRGPAVSLFADLSRRGNWSLLKQLQKDASKVGAEDLLYLGFALVERQGADRDAGAAVLKLVVKKFKAREQGKVARQKLKTQGF